MENKNKNRRWKGILQASLWGITLAACVLLMGFIKTKSEATLCTALEVIIPGEQSFIARKEVDDVILSKHGELLGRRLEDIPVQEIEEDLKAVPFIKKAMVVQDLEGKITIKIQQRTAHLRVINQHGEDFYLDHEGVKMPLSPYFAPRVLVANGFLEENFRAALDSIQTPLLKDLYAVAGFIKTDSLWNSQIEQLYVNSQHQIEMVPRVGTHKIVLGDGKELEEKFKKLLIFYRQVIPAMGWGAYRKVDLSFHGQLVCERNEG